MLPPAARRGLRRPAPPLPPPPGCTCRRGGAGGAGARARPYPERGRRPAPRLEPGAGGSAGSLRPAEGRAAPGPPEEPPLSAESRQAPRLRCRGAGAAAEARGEGRGERPGPAEGAARPAPAAAAAAAPLYCTRPVCRRPSRAPPRRARQEGRGLWSDGSEQAGAELPFHRSRH